MKHLKYLIHLVLLTSLLACDKKDEDFYQNKQNNFSVTVIDSQSSDTLNTYEFSASVKENETGELAFTIYGVNPEYLNSSDITIRLNAIDKGRYTIGSTAELRFNAYALFNNTNIEANAGFIEITDNSLRGNFTVMYNERVLLMDREKYRLVGEFKDVKF